MMAEDTSEPTLTLKELQQFFEERKPVLNVSPVGEEAGLSHGHLNKILKEERKLNPTNIKKLLPILHKYGYKMPDTPPPTTLSTEQLRDFLHERKHSISITNLAKEAEMSRSHLTQIISGARGFSTKTTAKLLLILPKYGFRG